jgi:pyruvate/2-oxoglutarate dehydrogenase complex dihydrolipoamide acyltransferase (E2) component
LVRRRRLKSLFKLLEKTIGMYSKKAKDKTLALEEMTGGTFTIRN